MDKADRAKENASQKAAVEGKVVDPAPTVVDNAEVAVAKAEMAEEIAGAAEEEDSVHPADFPPRTCGSETPMG